MSILRFTVIVALSVVATGACGDGGGSGDSVTPMVIDGDGAFDDIKAVMYLLEQPDVDERSALWGQARASAQRSATSQARAHSSM